MKKGSKTPAAKKKPTSTNSKSKPASKKKSPPKTTRKAVLEYTRLADSLVIKKKVREENLAFHRMEEIANELPYSYNETKLILLARDPFWGYSYWDFSGETWNWVQDLYKANPGLRSVLRVHNLNEKRTFDLDVALDAKNWYISLGKPNTEFEAELGLLGSDGRFYLIIKSNRIRTPRNSPADIIDPNWAPEDFDELYKLSGGHDSSKGASGLFSKFKKRTS